MSRFLVPPAILAAFVFPSLASSQGKVDHSVASVLAKGPVVHRVSDLFSVIDNGDTVSWVRRKPNSNAVDTLTFVFKGNSGVIIRPAPVRALSTQDAMRIRRMRDQLREMAVMDAEVDALSKR